MERIKSTAWIKGRAAEMQRKNDLNCLRWAACYEMILEKGISDRAGVEAEIEKLQESIGKLKGSDAPGIKEVLNIMREYIRALDSVIIR